MKDDVTHKASSTKTRDLLAMLDTLLTQDRAARRVGAASVLEDQLASQRHLWLLQSVPGQIAA